MNCRHITFGFMQYSRKVGILLGDIGYACMDLYFLTVSYPSCYASCHQSFFG